MFELILLLYRFREAAKIEGRAEECVTLRSPLGLQIQLGQPGFETGWRCWVEEDLFIEEKSSDTDNQQGDGDARHKHPNIVELGVLGGVESDTCNYGQQCADQIVLPEPFHGCFPFTYERFHGCYNHHPFRGDEDRLH